MQVENWNDLRVFLAVARTARLKNAAQLLRIDSTTVSRRLRRLERALGQRLLEQTNEGQVLTQHGERLLARVERMAEEATGVYQSQGNPHTLGGQLRLSVSEGFGSWFVAPRLAQLCSDHPELTIELVASSGFLSPSKREADIAIMLSRPKAGPLIARKLADYSLKLYARPSYLDDAGHPTAAQDLTRGHRLVGYISDLLYAPELDYLKEIHPDLFATVQSSSINAQMRLIAAGAGIGVLPCFMGDREKTIVRVLPEISISRSFWIVTHRDNHRLEKIRYVSEWLTKNVAEGRDILVMD
ncbi:LysR family transcriptional regulator [Aurantiacibacter odishensis]|uniref:LysR family transcriptional regulator n=1 Tax=Aurantiacibacter odishensis TaxID=1155476 RepID=UPI000E714111|nr:LysR family transcriptional regulator [Aurantiacibacter odishensis]